MEFTLPLPHVKDFAPMTADNWKTFNHRFRFYSKIQPKDIEVIQAKSESILLFLGGSSVVDVVKNFSIYNEEKDTAASIVLEMVSEICLPKFMLLYERFKFFTCKQKNDECICRFLFKLLQLSELCEFEDDVDSYVADRILHGVSDQQLRENLRHVNNTNLRTVTQICRTVSKCTNGQCCINFGTYSEAFHNQKTASASSSSGSTVGEDSIQEVADAVPEQCNSSEADSRIDLEEDKIAKHQPSFWQFEELIRKKSTVENPAESLTSSITTRSQTAQLKVHSHEAQNKATVYVSVKTEPLEHLGIINEECDIPASENHSESKSMNTFWDTVAFDDCDDDFGIKKEAKEESDSDSIDDVPVTVCVPSKEEDSNSKSSQVLERELELTEDCNKILDPIKIHGISRFEFAAKTGSPSPLVGVAVRSEMKVPFLTPSEVSDFTPGTVKSFTSNSSNNLENDCDIFDAEGPVSASLSDTGDSECLPGSSAFSESESHYIPSPGRDNNDKPTQPAGGFFDLYSGWLTPKPESNKAIKKSVSEAESSTAKKTMVSRKSDLTLNPQDCSTRRITRSRTVKDNVKVNKEKARDDSGSGFDDNVSVHPTAPKDGSTAPEDGSLLSEAKDAIEKIEAAEDVQTFFSLFDNYKISQDNKDRLSDCVNEECDSDKLRTDKNATASAEKSQSSVRVLNAEVKLLKGTSIFSQFDPYVSGKTKDQHHSKSEGDHSVRKISKDSTRGRFSKDSNLPRKSSRKGKNRAEPAVNVEPFLSQYGGYNSLLAMADQGQRGPAFDDYDYSDIVKRSVDEIVQGSKGLVEEEKDSNSFFSLYGSHKTSGDFIHSGSSSPNFVARTSEENKGKTDALVLNSERNTLEEEPTAPKLTKLAEKREIRTSEGAKKVSCLTLKL